MPFESAIGNSTANVIRDVIETMRYKTVCNEETLKSQTKDYEAQIERTRTFINSFFPKSYLDEKQTETKDKLIQNIIDNAESSSAQNSAAADSASESTDSVSSKGIKSDVNLTINGGNIVIDSWDDSIHANDTVVINGGTIEATSGDDGIHADTSLDINDGNINIKKSYEGIESQVINLNGGNMYVTSTDDGINAGGGSDGSSVDGRPARS